MRVVLIGADNEENLGLAMVASSLIAARHKIEVVAFSEISQLENAVAQTMSHRPEVVGLAMQFQHRGWEFVALAERLRQGGFRGHLTAGGQFATMACEQLLSETPSLDSVALYDAEETIVELVSSIRECRPITAVPGLAVRLDDGCVHRTVARRLPQELDRLPLPLRYRRASRHLGVPFVPMSGGRGCWGKCAFCSITTFYRDARSAGGGVGFRLRSPKAIAGEMALLTRREQSPCVFCFHDETLLLPRPADTLRRLSELTNELERLGVEGYGLVGKCRPDCLTDALARQLAAHHVIRLYVGIENASQAGQDHLSRRTRTEQLDRALAAVNQAGIFGCYNLLIFEPETTLADVRENIAFIRKHAENPVNFCRAEPYHGTPLWERLKASGELEGSWLGWDYQLHEPLAELLLRVTAVVFRQRNFDQLGVANRAMSLGYRAKLLAHFYPANRAAVERFRQRAEELTQRISLDTAETLEQCVELVEQIGIGDGERLEREIVRMGLQLAKRDGDFHSLIDQFVEDTEQYVAQQSSERRIALPERLHEALAGLAMVGCVAVAAAGCEESSSIDPAPSMGGRGGSTVVTGGAGGSSIGSGGSTHSAGMAGAAGNAGAAGSMATGGGAVVDPLPAPLARSGVVGPANLGGELVVGHFRDTRTRQTVRSRALPLYAPPELTLGAVRHRDEVQVCIGGITEAANARWESRGKIEGTGLMVRWIPADSDDQLRVAVRTHGGVTIAAVRARDLTGAV